MENKINNASLKFTCTQDWDAMDTTSEGRFCATCQKNVYDLTDKNVAYFVQIMQENDHRVCGRFTADQLIHPDEQKHNPYWKKWLVAAMVLIGFNTAAQKAKAQEKMMGKIAPKPVCTDSAMNIKLGEIAPMPNPAQLKTLHAYLAKHYKGSTSVNGRLLVSFTVSKQGALQQIAISSHLENQVRAEVLRILKSAPKWKDINGYNPYPLSLSLNFKNGKITPYVD
jgi:hypothetical protein